MKQDMQSFVDIHLNQKSLHTYSLPDIAYSVPIRSLDTALSNDGQLPFADMLYGLQQRSRVGNVEWQSLEPAMERLAQLIAPQDTREIITATGDDWWLEIGPIDLNAKLVTIQRRDLLIAAIVNRGDGRLRVAVFRPLDAKSTGYLIGLGQTPHPEYGVNMRENNWEYALDASAGMGNHYAAGRGEAYLSYWETGIGILHDGTIAADWRKMKDLTSRAAALVVTELGVHYSLSPQEQEESNDNTETDTEQTTSVAFPLWHSKRQQKRTVKGRFLGCLLGGAVGDALGAPVEFMRRSEIFNTFSPDGITEYAPAYSGLGTITDDTQMTLFTAEGLLRAHVRFCFKGICHIPSVVSHAYLRWLLTQGERKAIKGHDIAGDGWLFQQRALHNRRAPGNTCLSALKAMKAFGDPACNDSKGCGGVMRMAPVGLMAWRKEEGWRNADDAFLLGTELAAQTHGHPTGALTGGVLAVLVLALVDGASLQGALAVAKALLQKMTTGNGIDDSCKGAQAVCRKKDAHKETLNAIEMAEELAASSMPPHEAIAKLGQGWVAEEALSISIYCALVARNFREGVILAVNHTGDSDSTGSITGNLLGAMYGVKAIPSTWLEPLELREVITELAEDLYAWRDWDIGEYSKNEELNERIWRKYPGW